MYNETLCTATTCWHFNAACCTYYFTLIMNALYLHVYRYRDGMLEACKGLSETTTSAVNIAAEQLVELTENHGTDVVEEEDVDELLDWTNGLNYEQ